MRQGVSQAHLARLLFGASILYVTAVIADARQGLSPDLSARGLWRSYEAPRADPGGALLIDARRVTLSVELRARFGVIVADADLNTSARAREALGVGGALSAWRGDARALPGGAEVALVWAGEAGEAPRLIVGRYDGRWVWVSADGVRLGGTPRTWEGAPTLTLPKLRGRAW